MTFSGQHPAAARSGATFACPRALLGRLLRVLVCHLLPAVCLLVLRAAPAMAAYPSPVELAVGGEAAPMCDPTGASVAALPEIPEVDSGRFEELPCDSGLLLMGVGWLDGLELDDRAALRDTEPQQPQQLQHHRSPYDGACDFGVAFPSRCEPVVTCAPLRRGLSARRGHHLGVFRPPVARV